MHATREQVLAALAECDELGEAAFLKRYGYGRSIRYQLRHEGRSYPSKAILGVAAGLTSREFSGGAAHTVRVLGRLGFTIRDGKRPRTAGPMAALVALAATAWSFPALARPALPLEPVATFASGSNHAGEIRGWSELGHDIGVAANEIGEPAIQELEALAGSDLAIFVDSGAFSEVEFGPGGLVVKEAISADEWRRRLALYRRLALALGGQLHVVAPDRVGDQAVTLERLERYAHDLREIAELGAHILVPVQGGALGAAEFMRAAERIVGVPCIPAMPCKKAATTPEQLAEFCRDYAPARLHLLGLGIRGSRARKYLAAVAAHVPDAQVALDSCVIRAHCNKDRRIGIARRLALAMDATMTTLRRKHFELLLAFG